MRRRLAIAMATTTNITMTASAKLVIVMIRQLKRREKKTNINPKTRTITITKEVLQKTKKSLLFFHLLVVSESDAMSRQKVSVILIRHLVKEVHASHL